MTRHRQALSPLPSAHRRYKSGLVPQRGSRSPPTQLPSADETPIARLLSRRDAGAPYFPTLAAPAVYPSPSRYNMIPHFCTAVIPEPTASLSPLLPAPHPSYFHFIAYPRTRVGSRASQQLRVQRSHIPCSLIFRSQPTRHEVFSVERRYVEAVIRHWQEPCALTRVGTLHLRSPPTHSLTDSPDAATAPADLRTYSALMSCVERHSVTDEILAVQFTAWEPSLPLRLAIPVQYINEAESLGVRKGGMLLHVKHEVQVEYRGQEPHRIPSKLIVDLLHLPMGRVVFNSDLQLPEGCRLVAPQKQLVLCTISGLGKQVNWQDDDELQAVAAGAGAVATPAAGGAPAAAAGGAAKAAPAAAAAKKEEPKKK